MSDYRQLVLSAIGALCVFLEGGQVAKAFDIYWNGDHTAGWSDVDNWDPVGLGMFSVHRVPTDFDRAFLQTPVDDLVVLSSDTAPINGLYVSNGINLHSNGYRLTVDDAGAASTTFSGHGTQISIFPGLNPNPTELELDVDQLVVQHEAVLGFFEVQGQIDGTVSVTGGSLLEIQNGAEVSAGRLQIGEVFAGFRDGAVTVAGTGSRLDLSSTTGNHVIGDDCPGLLEFSDQAEGSIVGTLEVRGGYSGATDVGTFLVSTGASITTDSLQVTRSGVATVSGANSKIEQQGNATITVGGDPLAPSPATLTVVSGGQFAGGTGLISVLNNGLFHLHTRQLGGGTLNAGGDVLVSGGELRVDAGSTLTIPADGTLTIQNGGLADITGGFVVPDLRTVDVRDGGTLGVSAGELSVYDGTLHVWDGGMVNVTGENLTAEHFGFVTGGGTIDLGGGALTNSDASFVAPGDFVNPLDSTGTLTIQNGDYIQSSDGTLRIELGGPAGNDLLFVTGTGTGTVELDGTLWVSLLGNYKPQKGDLYNIILPTLGYTISGDFVNEILPSQYDWDVSVNPDRVVLSVLEAYLDADFDHNGVVEGKDFLAWQRGYGTLFSATHGDGDANDDGDVDEDDLAIWQSQYGNSLATAANSTVPEPGMLALLAIGAVVHFQQKRR